MADTPKPERLTSPKMGLGADDILSRVDSMPFLDPGCPDEIVGYDEVGLPTGEKPASLERS